MLITFLNQCARPDCWFNQPGGSRIKEAGGSPYVLMHAVNILKICKLKWICIHARAHTYTQFCYSPVCFLFSELLKEWIKTETTFLEAEMKPHKFEILLLGLALFYLSQYWNPSQGKSDWRCKNLLKWLHQYWSPCQHLNNTRNHCLPVVTQQRQKRITCSLHSMLKARISNGPKNVSLLHHMVWFHMEASPLARHPSDDQLHYVNLTDEPSCSSEFF